MTRPALPVIITAAVIMLTIIGAAFFYVGRRLSRFLRLVSPAAHTKWFAGICIFFVVVLAVSFLPIGNADIKRAFVWLASFMFAVFMYLFLLFAVSDLALFIGKLTKVIAAPVPLHIHIIAGYTVIALTFIITAYGVYNANILKTVPYAVTVNNKETMLDNMKIVLVADTHFGYLNGEKWLSNLVNTINAENPDIVCFAGDIFNDDINTIADRDANTGILRGINAAYGVYACFGNHDGGATYYEMMQFLSDSNITLLQDEYITIDDKFTIIGRTEGSPIGAQDKPRIPYPDVIKDMDTRLPVIIIDHNPAHIDEYNNNGADIVLCGHTHKGQMFPGAVITKLMYTVHYGLYQKNEKSPYVIVTSGAGVWGPPVRVGTKSEIASIDVGF